MSGRLTRRLSADSVGCLEAGALVRDGKLVAFPTETVYGLGADATNALAVAGIYEAKGRPRFNPLIIHVADQEQARIVALVSPRAEALMTHFLARAFDSCFAITGWGSDFRLSACGPFKHRFTDAVTSRGACDH